MISRIETELDLLQGQLDEIEVEERDVLVDQPESPVLYDEFGVLGAAGGRTLPFDVRVSDDNDGEPQLFVFLPPDQLGLVVVMGVCLHGPSVEAGTDPPWYHVGPATDGMMLYVSIDETGWHFSDTPDGLVTSVPIAWLSATYTSDGAPKVSAAQLWHGCIVMDPRFYNLYYSDPIFAGAKDPHPLDPGYSLVLSEVTGPAPTGGDGEGFYIELHADVRPMVFDGYGTVREVEGPTGVDIRIPVAGPRGPTGEDGAPGSQLPGEPGDTGGPGPACPYARNGIMGGLCVDIQGTTFYLSDIEYPCFCQVSGMGATGSLCSISGETSVNVYRNFPLVTSIAGEFDLSGNPTFTVSLDYEPGRSCGGASGTITGYGPIFSDLVPVVGRRCNPSWFSDMESRIRSVIHDMGLA